MGRALAGAQRVVVQPGVENDGPAQRRRGGAHQLVQLGQRQIGHQVMHASGFQFGQRLGQRLRVGQQHFAHLEAHARDFQLHRRVFGGEAGGLNGPPRRMAGISALQPPGRVTGITLQRDHGDGDGVLCRFGLGRGFGGVGRFGFERGFGSARFASFFSLRRCMNERHRCQHGQRERAAG